MGAAAATTGLRLSVGRYYSPPVFFIVRKPPLKDAKRFEGRVADPEKGLCGVFLLLLVLSGIRS